MFPLYKHSSRPEKLASIGTPYHGVVVDNNLNLTGSGGPNLTLAIGQTSSWNLSLTNPNRTLPTRSGAQITADAAVGRVYRDYALAPGRKVFGSIAALLATDMVYFDSRGYTWRLALADLRYTQSTALIHGDIIATRFLHIGDQIDATPVTTAVSMAAGSIHADLVPTFATITPLDQNNDGTKALLSTSRDPNRQLQWWELTVSDTINEGGGTYPYAGGTIAFNFSITVKRAPTAMIGTGSITITSDAHVVDWDNADPHTDIDSPFFNHSPTPADVNVRSCEVTARYIWCNYDTTGTLVEWSIDATADETVEFDFSGGGRDGTSTNNITQTDTGEVVIKRDGTAVETLSFTFTRHHDATAIYTAGVIDAGDGVDIVVDSTHTATGMANITGSKSYTDLAGGIGSRFPPNFQSGFLGGAFFSVFTLAQQYGLGANDAIANPVLPNMLATYGQGTYFWEYADRTGGSESHWPYLTVYGGNKIVSVAVLRVRSTITGDFFTPGSVSVSTRGKNPGKVHAPDSSHTTDNTERDSLTRDAIPAAYDPENDAWSSGAWLAGPARWEVKHYV